MTNDFFVYRKVGRMYSTTTRFEIRPMSGNILMKILKFKIRFFRTASNQCFESIFERILAVITSVYCLSSFPGPFSPVFHFLHQSQILIEISQNFANISRHGSNFVTSGGRVHAPDICLQLAKTRLSVRLKRLQGKRLTFLGYLKKSYLNYPRL